jgi:hypothetical protein
MKPFLHGRKENLVKPLQAPASGNSLPAAKPRANSAGHEHGGAQVEVIKQGDKVIRIIVTCGCGERTEVECIYPAT